MHVTTLPDQGENTVWVENPTILQANQMFNAVSGLLGIRAMTKKGRKRRISEMSWKSALPEMRKVINCSSEFCEIDLC